MCGEEPRRIATFGNRPMSVRVALDRARKNSSAWRRNGAMERLPHVFRSSNRVRMASVLMGCLSRIG
jgi:hypothetical protein